MQLSFRLQTVPRTSGKSGEGKVYEYFLFHFLLHLTAFFFLIGNNFSVSIVEVFKLFFCHGVYNLNKNCAGVLLPREMLKYTSLLLRLLGTDEGWNG